MKKILAVMLAVSMLFALCACNSGSAVEKYVEENKSTIISAMETSFASTSGMSCTSDIEVIDNGFVVSININELDNVDNMVKLQMQSAYDSMSASFDSMLDEMQTEVPELAYFKIRICEVDGDLIAEINAK